MNIRSLVQHPCPAGLFGRVAIGDLVDTKIAWVFIVMPSLSKYVVTKRRCPDYLWQMKTLRRHSDLKIATPRFARFRC